MADKISQLPAAAALTGAEKIPMVQGGATVAAPASSFFQSDMRNLLINALGQINQRGYVSGTATTSANQYTVDRWKVQTSGQSLAWANANGVATFTAPAGGVAQVVEGANIQGGNYVLSWSGTAIATVNGTPVTSGVPFNLVANTNATVVFSNGTFAMPQLELGQFPTRFDWRLTGIELSLCMRYMERVADINRTDFTPGFWFSSTAFYTYHRYAVEKRAVPAMKTAAVSNFRVLTIGTGVAPTGFSSFDVGVLGTFISVTTGTVTPGTLGILQGNDGTGVNAYFDFDAEF